MTASGHTRRRWRLVALALLGAVLFAAFVALGTWQVQRRAWKQALIERVEQRVHAASVALPGPSEWDGIDAQSHEYLPVEAEGRWLPLHTVLVQAVTEIGGGFWVLTPLELADGSRVMVNRGFIPQNLRAGWRDGDRIDGREPVVVRGLVRMSEPGGGFMRRNDPAGQRWFSRDVTAMAQASGLAHLAPYFVDAGLPGDAPVPEGTWPRPGMTVIRFHNSHMAYILTWYGLAAMVAGAAWIVARYERRQRLAHPSEPSHDRHTS